MMCDAVRAEIRCVYVKGHYYRHSFDDQGEPKAVHPKPCQGRHCGECSCVPPVIVVNATPALQRPAYLDPAAIPPMLTGLRIDSQLAAGETAAAIVKDPAGQVLGYIAQSEVDRIQSIPSGEEIRVQIELIESMIGRGAINDYSIRHPQ